MCFAGGKNISQLILSVIANDGDIIHKFVSRWVYYVISMHMFWLGKLVGDHPHGSQCVNTWTSMAYTGSNLTQNSYFLRVLTLLCNE